jgi:hypothetical protein
MLAIDRVSGPTWRVAAGVIGPAGGRAAGIVGSVTSRHNVPAIFKAIQNPMLLAGRTPC